MNSRNETTLTGVCGSPSGQFKKTQQKTIVSSEDYNTGNGDTVNRDAETRTLQLLKESGFKNIQQLDWVGKKNGEWTCFEIKDKKLFTPGTNFPYWAAGLNKKQLWLRTQLLNDLGWRTYLLHFVKGTNQVYCAYLDELEKGVYYDTPNGIRVYPISSYKKERVKW